MRDAMMEFLAGVCQLVFAAVGFGFAVIMLTIGGENWSAPFAADAQVVFSWIGARPHVEAAITVAALVGCFVTVRGAVRSFRRVPAA